MTLDPFALRVVAWQRHSGRNHLPWSGQEAYSVWLSEVMLQQTQVATVLPFYAAFKAAFPTVNALAAAPLDDVLALWAGMGYYSRARNLHRCAQRVVAEFGGIFPFDLKALESLPGIGPSTAGAIASLALNQRAAILDGNVKRVHARHAGIAGWPGHTDVAKKLWQRAEVQLIDAAVAVQADHHRRYTQGLMDLGAMVCLAKKPHCEMCPVNADCAALHSNLSDTIPASRPKKVTPIQARHALVIHNDHGVWLERRPEQGLWGGLLSLPEAPNREGIDVLAKQLGLEGAGTVQPWPVHWLKHTFTHYQLHWTLWGLHVNDEPALTSKVFVPWSNVSQVGVPKAVLKAMAGRPS
jgi:A/G-specific adenine glycosylase